MVWPRIVATLTLVILSALADSLTCRFDKATAHAAAIDSAGRERPLYYDRALAPADLEGRTLRELSLMRNWIFARAGNPFRREWLRAYFEVQAWYQAAEAFDPRRLTSIDRANAEAIARYELSVPRARLIGMRDSLLALDQASEIDRIDLELLSERLGEWRGEQSGDGPSPLQDLSQLDRQLRVEQLGDLSRRDLALLRNSIYARRGRPFRQEWLRGHFMRFDWYRPDPRYSNARLTATDRRNLKLLRSLENEVGGPLKDTDHEAWLGGA